MSTAHHDDYKAITARTEKLMCSCREYSLKIVWSISLLSISKEPQNISRCPWGCQLNIESSLVFVLNHYFEHRQVTFNEATSLSTLSFFAWPEWLWIIDYCPGKESKKNKKRSLLLIVDRCNGEDYFYKDTFSKLGV
jgi:hypothetical protein